MSNGPQFFETRMGHKYYEGTMPKIAKALERIADALEGRLHEPPPDESATPTAIASRAMRLASRSTGRVTYATDPLQPLHDLFVDDQGEWREFDSIEQTALLLADIHRLLRNFGLGGRE